MLPSLLRRRLTIALTCLALAAPWGSAWALAGREDAQAGPRALAAPSALLAGLWERLASLWDEVGCGIDPSGACVPAPQQEPGAPADQGDVGCGIDPGGAPCVDRQ